jgi:uncharacterized protein (TIGR01244 family)
VKIRTVIGAAVIALSLSGSIASAQAPVTKPTVPGIVNFAKVETTVACAGATTPGALADVKKMGFNSVINLRMAGEAGFDLDAEAAAAKAAGINYFHLPFNNAAPDPAVVDSFLKVITDKSNEPAFIHCASANRAAMMWMVKRIAIDKWDVAKATEEATALGLTNPALKTFAIEQAQKH